MPPRTLARGGLEIFSTTAPNFGAMIWRSAGLTKRGGRGGGDASDSKSVERECSSATLIALDTTENPCTLRSVSRLSPAEGAIAILLRSFVNQLLKVCVV